MPWGLNRYAGNVLRNWTINDVDHSELDTGDIVVLRAPDGAVGSSDIALTLSSQGNILQRLLGGFTVNFK